MLNLVRFVPGIVLFWDDDFIHYMNGAACFFYVASYMFSQFKEMQIERLHLYRTLFFVTNNIVHAFLLLAYKKAVQWSLVLTALFDLVSVFFCFSTEDKNIKNT